MDMWFVFLDLLIPTVMVVFGILWRVWPPRKINNIYGYRSKRSMASQKAWNAAHAHLSKAWLILGIIILAITTVLMLALPIDAETFLLSAVIVQIVVMFVPVPFIERRLHEEYGP